ncbi:protein ecdysoneless homolog [Oppia nitens]|uniref:protein ecdysoneless homolog n=1 Tax=Oppia nitens TaxID=1686743 RepID=UPI0023DA4261|nr:protein ecdysoneless homolog [Oppia nitens]
MAFNKDLNENSVLYRLYPLLSEINGSLNDYICKCYTYLAKYISTHIWQNQSFQLSIITDSIDGDNHLQGITNFGDNIDDEWLIVYLLYRLSRLDPNLVIKVEDSDGEFLLIEAANDLPKWCEPSNCLNRVFIYRQSVHIIPINCKSFANRIPSIKDSIEYIRRNPDKTRAQEAIQRNILRRIECFPKRIKEYQHKSHCFVPIGVAALLKHNPGLISWAVNAFYNRTPDDHKVCQAMKYFPPENRVMCCVTFTRCLYGQLMSQSYTPDVRVGWNLPQNNSRDFKSHDLGVKIASGFEILISSSKFSFDGNDDQLDFKTDSRWLAFNKSLVKNGYFGNERNGSKNYNELLKRSQIYFQEFIYNNQNIDELDCFETKGEKIYKLLQTLEIDEKIFGKESQNLEKEDSDEWLNIDCDELDALLAEKFCSTNKSNNCSEISTQIPSTLQAFVSNQKSGLKGAEAPKSLKTSKIDFNEDTFNDALSTVLSLKIPQLETDSSSGMSDYSEGEDSIDSEDDCYENDFSKPELNGAKEKLKEMKDYMKAMDQQLAGTSVGRSFERRSNDQNSDEYKRVDIDLNALTNILESYSAECGVPGPATALFSTMGVRLPDNKDTDQL